MLQLSLAACAPGSDGCVYSLRDLHLPGPTILTYSNPNPDGINFSSCLVTLTLALALTLPPSLTPTLLVFLTNPSQLPRSNPNRTVSLR